MKVGLLSGMVIEASSKRQHTNGKSAAPRCWIAVKPTLTGVEKNGILIPENLQP